MNSGIDQHCKMERPSLPAMVVRFKVGVVTLESREVVCAVTTGIVMPERSVRAKIEERMLCRSLLSRSRVDSTAAVAVALGV